jgi:hypothetical protein
MQVPRGKPVVSQSRHGRQLSTFVNANASLSSANRSLLPAVVTHQHAINRLSTGLPLVGQRVLGSGFFLVRPDRLHAVGDDEGPG